MFTAKLDDYRIKRILRFSECMRVYYKIYAGDWVAIRRRLWYTVDVSALGRIFSDKEGENGYELRNHKKL